MNFLKNLFGGGGKGDDGLYVYVQPKACDEIVMVRIDTTHGLSRRDDGDGYFMRKMASGTRCPFQAEMFLYFDNNKRLVDRRVENGTFVTRDDYIAKYGSSDDTSE